MTHDEAAAKKAFESMAGQMLPEYVSIEDHRWEDQSEAVRADWLAMIGQTVRDERDACAALAEDEFIANCGQQRGLPEIHTLIRARGT